jgi:hypothetical protein
MFIKLGWSLKVKIKFFASIFRKIPHTYCVHLLSIGIMHPTSLWYALSGEKCANKVCVHHLCFVMLNVIHLINSAPVSK